MIVNCAASIASNRQLVQPLESKNDRLNHPSPSSTLFFFFFRVRFMMSTYPMSILYGYFEMLWSSASGHLEFDSFLSWYFLLTSTPPLQGLAPWASAHVSRSILTFSTWQGGVQRSPFDVRFFFRRVGNDRTSMHCFPSRRVAVGKAKFLKF